MGANSIHAAQDYGRNQKTSINPKLPSVPGSEIASEQRSEIAAYKIGYGYNTCERKSTVS